MSHKTSQHYIEMALVKELKNSCYIAAVMSFIFVSMFQYSIYKYIDSDLSNRIIVSILLVSFVLRLVIRNVERLELKQWLNIHAGIVFTHSLCWSALMFNVISTSNMPPQVITMCALVFSGLVAASAFSLGTSKQSFYSFTLPIISTLFVCITLISEDTSYRVSCFSIIIIFCLFLYNQQKKTEASWKQLVMYNYELKNLMDSVPGSILVIKKGICVSANARAEEHMARKNLKTPLHLTEISNNSEFNYQVLKFEKSDELSAQFETSFNVDNTRKFYMVNMRRSFTGREVIVSLVETTEIKKIEMENAQHKIRQFNNAKMVSLGEMAGSIAHEINNPLSIILGKSQMLKSYLNTKTLTEDKLESTLGSIISNSQRISGAIKGLREFAQDNENGEFEEHSLLEVVNKALALNQARIEKAGIKLSVEIPDNIKLNCIANKLAQVVYVGLSNAYEAVLDSPTKEIRISCEADTENIFLKIYDSGRGIPESIREKVFDPFFSTKDVGQGTGLGLSIAKSITDLHKGELYFNYNIRNGCELVLKLKKHPNILDSVS